MPEGASELSKDTGMRIAEATGRRGYFSGASIRSQSLNLKSQSINGEEIVVDDDDRGGGI
jgi:hypothetical protein